MIRSAAAACSGGAGVTRRSAVDSPSNYVHLTLFLLGFAKSCPKSGKNLAETRV
jgi:hypothetical protein